MGPSLGRDAVLDVVLFILKAFDRLSDHYRIRYDYGPRDLSISGDSKATIAVGSVYYVYCGFADAFGIVLKNIAAYWYDK